MIYPMYHPAAALHNPGLRPALQRDFSTLPELIREVAERQATGETPKPKQESDRQLSMFE